MHCVHCRVRAGCAEGHLLSRRHDATDDLGHFDLAILRPDTREIAHGKGVLDSFIDAGVAATKNQWSPSQQVIDVSLTRSVPHVGAGGPDNDLLPTHAVTRRDAMWNDHPSPVPIRTLIHGHGVLVRR